MKKVASNWIDSAKVRKEMYDFNQAIRNVFIGYRYIDGMVIPIAMAAIKNRNIFARSLFFHTKYPEPFPFLEDSIVYPEPLAKALKDKCTEYQLRDGVHCLSGKSKDGKELNYQIGTPMTENQKEDSSNYTGLVNFYKLHETESLGSYTLTDDDMKLILDYKVLEVDIAEYNGKPVHFIASKELFPVIKKVDNITINVYKNDRTPNDIFEILIASNAPTWTFYSMHYLLSLDIKE